MAYTDTWDVTFEGVPQDTDNIADGADVIRDLKLGIRERMQHDHYMDPAGTDADHGEHMLITLRQQAAPGSPGADKAYLYGLEADSKCELHYKDEDNNIIKLTKAGRLNEGLLKDEDDLSSDSDLHAATQQSIKAYVDAQVATGVGAASTGLIRRPRLVYVDTDTVSIGVCVAHHNGTSEQVLQIQAAQSLDLTGLSTSEWQFLYFDDSAIVTAGTNIVTATEIINNTTVPSWNDAKQGYYNSLDRCFGALWINSSGEIEKFYQMKGGMIHWDAPYEALPLAYVNTDWSTQVTFRAPSIATDVYAVFESWNASNVQETKFYYRRGDSTGNGFLMGKAYHDDGGDNQGRPYTLCSLPVPIDASQQIDVKQTSADTNARLVVHQHGYFLPKGM